MEHINLTGLPIKSPSRNGCMDNTGILQPSHISPSFTAVDPLLSFSRHPPNRNRSAIRGGENVKWIARVRSIGPFTLRLRVVIVVVVASLSSRTRLYYLHDQ